ncbi:MAG: S1/P1 nuclease [Cruoricaptor ignavus]|nr:S1/P1 nuclease [Cruoricaptor ignavus]
MPKIITKIVLLFLFYCSTNVFAWGTTGHRVVAEIAENNIKSCTKQKLKKIIGNQKLAYWANWPDFIKSDSTGYWKHADTWHYVNISPQSNYEDFVKELKAQKSPNLYTEIQRISKELKRKDLSQADKEINLRFLIHLVGDLAQPMHIGRAEDLGGNLIKIKYFGKDTNLHSLWDSKLIDNTKYSYTEYARVLDVKPRKIKKEIKKGSLEEWFFEYHKITNTIYNYTLPDKNYSYAYNYRFNDTLEKQLYYGGLRLAKILDEVL